MDYRFEYAESFWLDYAEAIHYICDTLNNPIAARDLDERFERIKRTVLPFPAAYKPFAAPPEVETPYYTLPVGSYLAFYVVLDGVIEFRRFLYAHSDLPRRLDL